MLLDRCYNIGISSPNDRNSRNFILLASDRAHAPIQSEPIGRIDYLDANGEVENSIEYTNSTSLERDIKEENTFDVRMAVYLYKDSDGNTIPHDFIDRLPNPLQHFEIVNKPLPQSEYDVLLDEAKRLIDEFVKNKYDSDSADYSDLSEINIGYTNTEDEKHEIEAVVNLVDFRIETRVDGQVVHTDQYDSLADIVENGLNGLDFSALVYVSDEQLAPFYQSSEPAEEQPEAEAEIDNSDLIGKELTLNNRNFIVERIDRNGDASMRDITFEDSNGFPIFRVENADFVRSALELSEKNELDAPAWERKQKAKAQTFDLHPEIPLADRYTFDLKNFELEEVGKKARYRRNIDAIRVLKQCERDNRFATPEEQQILAQYVGWGGIPEAFDENNAAWQSEYNELSQLLSDEEYQSARESTLTAFYTPPVVISAIYKVMEQMKFKEGNILEPSCGIGNFIGMLPQSMQNSHVYGVEIDKISAGIAQQLYKRSSIAGQPFEQAEIPDSFFDAVVGNVPFGDFSVADKRYDKNHFLIHDYFFAKSLDKLRPGGVMALVTSKGTMDKENPAVRKYIAQRAELLGAIRLPNDTFKGNAGTGGCFRYSHTAKA